MIKTEVLYKGISVFDVFFRVEFIRKEDNNTPNEIREHDGYDNQSEDVVDVENKVFLHNRNFICVLSLEGLKQLAKARNVD